MTGIGEGVEVDHPHTSIGAKYVTNEVRTDEPSPAGDQH